MVETYPKYLIKQKRNQCNIHLADLEYRNSLSQIIETDCFKTRMVFEFQIIYGGNQKPEFETPLTTSTITFAHKNNKSPLFDVYTQFRGMIMILPTSE